MSYDETYTGVLLYQVPEKGIPLFTDFAKNSIWVLRHGRFLWLATVLYHSCNVQIKIFILLIYTIFSSTITIHPSSSWFFYLENDTVKQFFFIVKIGKMQLQPYISTVLIYMYFVFLL